MSSTKGETHAFPEDFDGRLRQVQLPPRVATINLVSSEAIVAETELLQARHAGCSSCTAYARTVIRSQLVAKEAEVCHGREMREGAAEVRCA